jgi:hypothetical protein
VKLKIRTQPPDAEVWMGNEKLGTADDDLKLERGDAKVTLTIKKPGYLPKELVVTPSSDVAEAVVLVPAPVQQKGYVF